MTPQLLEEIGLNNSQAKVYLCLIEMGALTPPQVADEAKENRTNAYMVLEQLEKLGLAEKVSHAKKLTYQATNPINLEKVSEKRRKEVMDAELRVKQAMPTMLSYYYNFTEKPGVRIYEGAEALKEIYQDILRTKQTLYLIGGNKLEVERVVGESYIKKFIAKRVQLGINVVAITPDTPSSNKDPNQDKEWLYHRTWIPKNLYDEAVEIDVYGNKVAFISFGEEVFGTIIDSPQIAQAMRKLIIITSQKQPEILSEPQPLAPLSAP